MNDAEKERRIAYLKRRLGAHRRSLRYWSGNPSFTGYGPHGKKLTSGNMSARYELAEENAHSIASELAKLGVSVRVVDPKRTFKARYNDPKHPEVLIYP